MSVVSEVLEREIEHRNERVRLIVVDLDAIMKRVIELHDLANTTFDEIDELNDALKIEKDHIERSTEVLSS